MIEIVMTYEQWQEEYTKRKKIKRKEFTYYLMQKIIGLLIILLSIFVPSFLDGDATVSILLIPLGIYTMLTNKKVISI